MVTVFPALMKGGKLCETHILLSSEQYGKWRWQKLADCYMNID